MKFKYIAFTLSGMLIILSILNITTGKGLNLGIDFAGGSLIRLMFKDQVPISDVRQNLSAAGLEKSRIQEMGKTEREYIIRTLQAAEGEEAEG